MTEKDWWIWNYIGEKDSLNKLGLNLNPEQIEDFLSAFMEIFDNDWYNGFSEEKRERILNRHFRFNCGPYSITWIIRLGECLQNLREFSGFDDEMVIRLKDKKQFESTSIELDCGSCFVQSGIDLKLQPLIQPINESADMRKCDGILVLEGKPIFYEIISQNPERDNRKRREYSNKIPEFLKYKFGSKSTFIKFKKRDNEAKTIIKKLFNILEPGISPFNYEDDDLEIRISDTNGGSTILGDILNREKKLENWIKKVHKKYKQLPSNIGGVIIANSSRLWDPQDIEIVRKTSWRETKEGHKSRISGIIFCVRQMLGIPSISGERLSFVSPRLLVNRFSKFDYTDELKKIASAIGSFPDWM